MSAPASAPHLIWLGAGEPEHKYEDEDYGNPCATCGVRAGRGVDTDQVNNPTFANHAEFFRFGSHVCRACAWLYGDPKRTHRNVLAVGDEVWWPMISHDSATVERPSWLDLLGTVADDPARYPGDSPWTGVLTTDPKPRNWPRCRLASAASPGLYLHAPDYDVSEWRSFGLPGVLEIASVVRAALDLGFSKRRVHAGLLSDYQKAKKNIEEVMELEEALREYRMHQEFVPALLIAGKGKDRDGTGTTVGPERAGEARGEAHEDDHRLF